MQKQALKSPQDEAVDSIVEHIETVRTMLLLDKCRTIELFRLCGSYALDINFGYLRETARSLNMFVDAMERSEWAKQIRKATENDS